jgi:23S rRNA (uracil747-C5)-methyltransferase
VNCAHHRAGRCRSCDLLGAPDPTVDRERFLQELLAVTPRATLRGPSEGFRDKIKITVGGTVDHPVLGLLRPDLSGVEEIHDCPVQAPALNARLPALAAFITRWRLTPYDIAGRTGELKGLILSRSPTTGESMLRFVLRSREALDRIRQGLPALADFDVVSVNLQPIPHALLEGPEEILLSAKEHLHHRSARGVTLCYTPQSFMQTNTVVADALYAEAADWLAPWSGKRGLDLFCGTGGFALHLAPALEMAGAELNASAIQAARTASALNQLNVRFDTLAAHEAREFWKAWSPDVVVVNPPRRGLGEGLSLVMELAPPVLLYSSCSPASFAADFSTLKSRYNATQTRIFEMFPHTQHFEVLTLLVRS